MDGGLGQNWFIWDNPSTLIRFLQTSSYFVQDFLVYAVVIFQKKKKNEMRYLKRSKLFRIITNVTNALKNIKIFIKNSSRQKTST